MYVCVCVCVCVGDVQLPDKVVDAMQMQVSAERRKRAQILESEGQREAVENQVCTRLGLDVFGGMALTTCICRRPVRQRPLFGAQQQRQTASGVWRVPLLHTVAVMQVRSCEGPIDEGRNAWEGGG